MMAAAGVLAALLLAGCSRTLYDKAVTLTVADPVHEVEVDAPTREQKVTVEFESPGVPVDVWVVLAGKRAAVRNKLLSHMRPNDSDVLAGKEQAEGGTVEATVPAGKDYVVLVGKAKKKTEVKLKVMGR
jgi:hypothetical protein